MFIPFSYLRDVFREINDTTDSRQNKPFAYTRDTLFLLNETEEFTVDSVFNENIEEVTNIVQSAYRISRSLDALVDSGSSGVSSRLNRLDSEFGTTRISDHKAAIEGALSGYFSERSPEEISQDFEGLSGFSREPEFTKEIVRDLDEGSTDRFIETANEALSILSKFSPSMKTLEAIIVETRSTVDDLSGFGTGGNDRLKANEAGVAIGFNGNDTLLGSSIDNDLRGGYGKDKLVGRGGDDNLIGDFGADLLRGGGGRDTLSGGASKDNVFGNGGSDLIYGGAGNDRLFGGGGNDTINGGVSGDVLASGEGGEFRSAGPKGPGNDIMVGGAGRDTFQFTSFSSKAIIKDFRLDVDEIEVLNLDVLIPGAFRPFPFLNAELVKERPSEFVLSQRGEDASLKYDASRPGTRKFEVIIEGLDVSGVDVSDLFFA